MKHPLTILSIVTFLSLGFLMVLVGYWLFWPDNIVTISNPNSIQIDKAVYAPGDRITYTLSYCKTAPMTANVMRALVNDYRTLYDTVESNLPTGCHTTKINELTIPSFAPDGTYHLTGEADYKINPLRTFTVMWRTVDFQVKQNNENIIYRPE